MPRRLIKTPRKLIRTTLPPRAASKGSLNYYRNNRNLIYDYPETPNRTSTPTPPGVKEEQEDERKRRLLLLILLFLLLLCCFVGYLFVRYLAKPQPLPQLLPIPVGAIRLLINFPLSVWMDPLVWLSRPITSAFM